MRNLLILGLTALLLASARGEDAMAAKKDLMRLQGEWQMVGGTNGGQLLPPAMVKSSKRVCKADETTVMVGGELFMKARFTLDPAKEPKSIDYQVTGGPNAGKTQLGIYEIAGDTVKFCFAAPGGERPGDFTTKAGDGRTATLWKREKK